MKGEFRHTKTQNALNSLANDAEQVILLQARLEAFPLEAVLTGFVSTQEIQGQSANSRQVFCGMTDALPQRVFPEGHVERPM